MGLAVQAPAKLNLRLKVTGKRSDGYHELVSIMVPVDLCDLVELQPGEQNYISIASRGIPVPDGEKNLAFRAAQTFFSRTGLRPSLSIRLTKNIPVAAGLGGGSSDAGRTLLALNELHSSPLSRSELHRLALGLGADVPFFLDSRPSLARGIGEILEPMRSWPIYWYVIVTPPLEVSTAWVYRNLKIPLTTKEDLYIVDSLERERLEISRILENDLEVVTASRFPIVDVIKHALVQAGADGALMSGSGPSVFGVFHSRDQALRAKEDLIPRNLGDVFVAAQFRESGRHVF